MPAGLMHNSKTMKYRANCSQPFSVISEFLRIEERIQEVGEQADGEKQDACGCCCHGVYLSRSHAFTNSRATAKNTIVKRSMSRSNMAGEASVMPDLICSFGERRRE